MPHVPFLSRSGPAEKEGWLAALRAAMPDIDIEPFERLGDHARATAQVAIVADPDPADLRQLPNLRWVQSLWAGVERIVAELPKHGVTIVRMEDPEMARTMAEAVLAWTLYLHRDMPRYRHQQTEAKWREHPLRLPSDRTIGVLGLGNLGRQAARALLGQGFTVCGWSRSQAMMDQVTTFHGRDGLASMLSRSDIVVVLLPLTAETRGLLNAAALRAMRRGACLINFARGPIVDATALLAALDSGHLDHAVLDVFDEEPLPPSSRLWSHPSVTVLPHVSAPTNRQTASRIVADKLRRYFECGDIPAAVDRARGY